MTREHVVDESDQATEQEIMATETVLNRIRAASQKLEVEATGECLFCGDVAAEGVRWCDAECRDGWSKWRRNDK